MPADSPLPAANATTPPPDGWWRRRVRGPLLDLLRQGLTPEQLALTVAVGVGIGVVPFLGAITSVATVVALRLRLNIAALQLISHLMTPVQLLLLVPQLRLGARLIGNTAATELTLANVRTLFAHDWRAALHLLWQAELGALLVWAGAGLPLVAILNWLLRPAFRRLARRKRFADAALNED